MLEDNNILRALACPHCHAPLSELDSGLECQVCHRDFPVREGLYDFRQREEYWCNVSREKMQQLNSLSRSSGDWLQSAREVIPEYLGHMESFDRADAQFLWPISDESRVLDAGSMWGGVTLPVAQYCGEVFAVDKTVETLNFLRIRAEQMGFRNVRTVAATLRNLPFPDGYFDLVILNGVLEWVAFDQEVVLESHWGRKRDDTARYPKKPRRMQVDVLQELGRVLKPGGHLYLAIENSIGYQYLLGTPDDHVNLKYVSFLPRFLANFITRRRLNCDYRTYTYSLGGYRRLLRDAGFNGARFYGAFPHYIRPSQIVPEELIPDLKESLFPTAGSNWYKRAAAAVCPDRLLKHISPSFSIVSRSGEGSPVKPRLVQILEGAGILSEADAHAARVVKCGGREGDQHPANFAVYRPGEDRPAYFCKVCRNMRHAGVLESEARNLAEAGRLLAGADIAASIPGLLHFGTEGKVVLLVTSFIPGKTAGFHPEGDLSTKNLAELDKRVRLAIGFLVRFQKQTRKRDVGISYLAERIGEWRDRLAGSGRLPGDVSAEVESMKDKMRDMSGVRIPLCARQGDYDFYSNILFDGDRVGVVDFEHFEAEALPFFDLATLIFHPVLLSWKHSSLPFSSFIDKTGIRAYIHSWLALYGELSGTPAELLSIMHMIAAIEVQAKDYPYYRDPHTFPIYESFSDLMKMGPMERR